MWGWGGGDWLESLVAVAAVICGKTRMGRQIRGNRRASQALNIIQYDTIQHKPYEHIPA